MKPNRLFLFGFLLPIVCVADEVLTLYGPVQTDDKLAQGQRLSLSPLGVNADGETTYLWNNIISETPQYGSGTEVTGYASIPVTTVVGTIVANEKHIQFSAIEGPASAKLVQECKFGPDGGSCIKTVIYNPILNGPASTTTEVTSYTGPLAPYYTITVANANVKPTTSANP